MILTALQNSVVIPVVIHCDTYQHIHSNQPTYRSTRAFSKVARQDSKAVMWKLTNQARLDTLRMIRSEMLPH
jgi:hypothetical protein